MNITNEMINKICKSEGFTFEGDRFVWICRNFTKSAFEMDQNVLYNALIKKEYNPKWCEVIGKNGVELHNIKENWLLNHTIKDDYRAENSLYALLLMLTAGYNVDVALTLRGSGKSNSGDGGFDIIILDQNTQTPLLIIDTKCGSNADENLPEIKDCWFLRAVRDPENHNHNIGSKYSNYYKKIVNISWEHLFENLAAAFLNELSYAEKVNTVSALSYKMNELLK